MPYYKFRNNNHKLKIGKIICLARTYKKHAKEMDSDIFKEPVLFFKPSSSIIFNDETIIIPKMSKSVHHEVEMGIIIKNKCKNVSKKDAMNYVLGYLVGLDITARDIQTEAKKKGLPWSIAKGFDTFTPISSVILKENITNYRNLSISLKVNGKLKQNSNTKNMLFSIPEIIEYISKIMTLEKGDLILTGTPEGVNTIENGDILEANLGDILSLKVNVKDE